MATINDIAKQLGISKSTVSKGLNHATDISEELRQKILETAAELGYANKKLKKSDKKLCIFIENMHWDTPHHFGYDIVRGFRQFAEADGWKVDIIPATIELQKLTPYTVFMIQNGYHASFVLGFTLLDPWMRDFGTCKIPTVLYDNYVKNNPFVASVGCDNQEGFELSVKHLHQLGHRKIGLISGPMESYITNARHQAYMNALSKYNLEINEDFIRLGYYASEAARKYVPALMRNGVTAILFSHDIRAIAAINECNSTGIRVPEDLSIIGFDDLPLTTRTEPALTTIHQDRLALGRCGYYAISSLLNEVPIGSILLRAPLIVRGSTGPVPKNPHVVV
ncbi:MAG: LacI family DNA-binding transcriptional regulator [Lachnospiraceae bacterium]|nr:LacI family DNA-binding transcriptional regulator [Lachnospiraceae bacterium]